MRDSPLMLSVKVAATVVIAAIVIFPMYWMVVVSLSPVGFSRTVEGWFPAEFTFRNYVDVFQDRPMARWIGNSLVLAISSSFVALAVGTTAGYVMSRFKFRGAGLFASVILATQMMPSTSIVVPMYGLLRDVGLLNTLSGVSLAHMTIVIPLAVWLIKGFFESIPPELEKAARVDGCTRWSAFWHVSLPLAAPGLVAVFLYGFVASWHEFLFSRTFASSQNLWSAAVGLSSFKGEYFSLFEPQMAAAVIFAMPMVVLFLVLQRRLIAGGLAGAVR